MTEPTDAEIIALCGSRQFSTIGAVREALRRWGTPPAVAGGAERTCPAKDMPAGACCKAQADSVTAPAGPSKSLPYEPTSAMLIAARERDPALPIETVRAIYWSMWRTAPTQPAQAADSVLEDAARDVVAERQQAGAMPLTGPHASIG